ncbi:ash family protein [Buttiauxella ferragutiae]|uniref:ash family protein n=1 Tax=Buttiauxella ferragutiae TaxID=82989 RepID=UPI003524CA05
MSGKQLAFRLLAGWLTLPIYVIVSAAAAKSAAGFRSLKNYLGNTYVKIMCCASVHLSNTAFVFAHSMVAQAGQSSDWPVSKVIGTANLV